MVRTSKSEQAKETALAGYEVAGVAKRAARRVRTGVRTGEALELRAAGWTLEEIAKKLGYPSTAAVANAIQTSLRQRQYGASEVYRSLQNERIEAGIRALYDRYLNGELGAVDRMISLFTRQAKLLGLDTVTPTSTTMTFNDNRQVLIADMDQLSLEELRAIAAMYTAEEEEEKIIEVEPLILQEQEQGVTQNGTS